MVNQHIGNHGLGIFWCGRISPWTSPSRSNEIAKLKVVITRLSLVLEVWDGKPTYRKSWARNLLVWSDLTLGPLVKVKQG